MREKGYYLIRKYTLIRSLHIWYACVEMSNIYNQQLTESLLYCQFRLKKNSLLKWIQIKNKYDNYQIICQRIIVNNDTKLILKTLRIWIQYYYFRKV